KRAARRAAKGEAQAPAKPDPVESADIEVNSNSKVGIVEVGGEKFEFDPSKHISFNGEKTGTVSLFGENIGTFTRENNGRMVVKLKGANRTVAVANSSGLLAKKTFLHTQRSLIEKNKGKLTKVDADESAAVADGDT